MALKFKKAIETESGITIENVYARIEYKHLAEGKKVQVHAKYYASEAAYEAQKCELKTDLPSEQLFDYDRVNDGFDVLQFAHDKFKQYLIDSYKLQPVLNEEQTETIDTIYFFAESDLLIEL